MKQWSYEEQRKFYSDLEKLQTALEQLRNGLESEETPMRTLAIWNIVLLTILGIVVWAVVR